MSDPEAAPAPGADGRGFFLPDFCEARAVLAIVLIAALLAIVLALARQTVHGAFWIDLARTSAYLLWTGLACAAVLCKARPRLAGKPLRTAVLGALGLMVGTVAIVSEVVYWVGHAWAMRTGSSLTLRYFYVTSEWRRSVELEARSRIRALQARIRPHFLFNSLNTVASLTRSDPARAEEAIEDLADLFRVSLSDARAQISLREELEVARIYQRIEQLRLGDRLQVRWKVADLPADAICSRCSRTPSATASSRCPRGARCWWKARAMVSRSRSASRTRCPPRQRPCAAATAWRSTTSASGSSWHFPDAPPSPSTTAVSGTR